MTQKPTKESAWKAENEELALLLNEEHAKLFAAVEALKRIRDWRGFRHTGEVRDLADQVVRKLER